MEIQNNSVLQFAEWLKRTHPQIYAMAVNKNAGLSGLGDTAPTSTTTPAGTTSFLDDVLGIVKQSVPVLLGTYQQKQLIDINVERAKQGLPPIDQTGIAPQVNVQLQPDQMTQVTQPIKYALFGVFGLGLLFIILNSRKRRG